MTDGVDGRVVFTDALRHAAQLAGVARHQRRLCHTTRRVQHRVRAPQVHRLPLAATAVRQQVRDACCVARQHQLSSPPSSVARQRFCGSFRSLDW